MPFFLGDFGRGVKGVVSTISTVAPSVKTSLSSVMMTSFVGTPVVGGAEVGVATYSMCEDEATEHTRQSIDH